MKLFWTALVVLCCFSCGSDTTEGSSSSSASQKETSSDNFKAVYVDQWQKFKDVVRNGNPQAMVQFMQFPMGGDCLPGQILLAKPNNKISALDFATHGGKMLTPEFKQLVADSDIDALLESKNADNRFDLIMKETKTSFEGDVVTLTTTYQFQIQGDQIKMVAIYCMG